MARWALLLAAAVAGAAAGAQPELAIAGNFSAFPGYAGPLRAGGALYLRQAGAGRAELVYTLYGLDQGCSAAFLGSAGRCAVRLHAGASCADLGAELEAGVAPAYATGAWALAAANLTAGAARAARSVVLTDRLGVPFACARLEPYVDEDGEDVTVSAWQRYPGYTGGLDVSGTIRLHDVRRSGGGGAAQLLTLVLFGGLDPACVATDAASLSAANACGVHVHAGASCASAAAVGGHFWDRAAGASDPWAAARYHPEIPMLMLPPVPTGLGLDAIRGRTLVVHDITGARIACAEIPSPAA